MLVGLPNEHISLHYTQHKMRRGKNASCRRCGVEKESSENIVCECLVLEKISMQTLKFVRMNSDQIKEAGLKSIVAFGKGAGPLNSAL